MVNMLDRGSAHLVQRRKDVLAKAITYRQGATSVFTTATVSKTEFQIESGTGLMVGFTSVDFLIAAADLSLTPARGDTITLGSEIYTVMIEGSSELPWKWSDASARTTYRIHTKRTT